MGATFSERADADRLFLALFARCHDTTCELGAMYPDELGSTPLQRCRVRDGEGEVKTESAAQGMGKKCGEAVPIFFFF